MRIRRTNDEWLASPVGDENAYQLAFTMPEQVEAWITGNEDERVARTRQIKADLLSAITIYDVADKDGEPLVYQLRYAAGSLRHR
ncbi:hypothetical protein [Actinospica robiniae]|uniref:hypothetical protein n=1 Tax=Actinospica robiniae TaxID=304901 RepID=UPI00040EF107|nr:hypothetical protein [Actinospica robiniae]